MPVKFLNRRRAEEHAAELVKSGKDRKQKGRRAESIILVRTLKHLNTYQYVFSTHLQKGQVDAIEEAADARHHLEGMVL